MCVRKLVKTMALEDQSQRYSDSNTSSGTAGGGIGNNIGRSSSSKKEKQRPKKVPQRGLGVAQLEKIRIEEQQKKDAAEAAAISPSQSSSVHKSSYLPLPIPIFHPSNQSTSSFADVISPPNSICRTPLSVQNVDDIVRTPNTVPLTNCSGSPGPGWHPGAGSLKNGHKFWSSFGGDFECNIEKECSGLDFRTNLMSFPCESEPIWPLPCLMQRPQPFQQPSSSMVNLSSRTSSTSALNFQTEPPSNQSYYGSCKPLLPEEEKVIGMKRSYPFSVDNASGPSIHTRYPRIRHSINGQVEAACNGITFNFEPGTPNFREGPSTSNLESKSNKSITKQNGVFDGDFLTLALPTTTSMCSSSKFKQPPPNLIYYHRELPDLESLAYQPSFEDSIIRQGGATGLNQYYRPYYSFFPPAIVQIDRATTLSMANCNGNEVGGHVDLDLKL